MGIYIMEIKKIIRAMKILILLAGILFLYVYTSYETSDCNMCSFDGNNINKFMDSYTNECLQVERFLPNISNYEPYNTYSEYPK